MKELNHYKVLHFDDYPILYKGENESGRQVIGSFMEEENDNLIKYIEGVVDYNTYAMFMDNTINYLEVLESAIELFIIERDIENIELSRKQIDFKDIPQDCLPNTNSFISKLKL